LGEPSESRLTLVRLDAAVELHELLSPLEGAYVLSSQVKPLAIAPPICKTSMPIRLNPWRIVRSNLVNKGRALGKLNGKPISTTPSRVRVPDLEVASRLQQIDKATVDRLERLVACGLCRCLNLRSKYPQNIGILGPRLAKAATRFTNALLGPRRLSTPAPGNPPSSRLRRRISATVGKRPRRLTSSAICRSASLSSPRTFQALDRHPASSKQLRSSAPSSDPASRQPECQWPRRIGVDRPACLHSPRQTDESPQG
jgi:hypothetical protein